MSVARVHHNKDYTCLSNFVFKDKSLSLKAKGLLCLMLSLPDEWNYSVSGLASLSSDGETSVRTAIKELENAGYVKREPVRQGGKIVDWNYDIYEQPLDDGNPPVENPQVGIPQLDFPLLDFKDNKVSNNQVSKDEVKKDKSISKDIHTATSQQTFVFGSRSSKGNSNIVKNQIAEQFKQLYEEHCPSLGKVKKLGENRVKLINKLYKSFTQDEILEGLYKVEASNFLTGKSSSWKATFDWIIKENNFTKILEGNYDNRKSYNTKGSLNVKNEQKKDIHEELDYSMKA